MTRGGDDGPDEVCERVHLEGIVDGCGCTEIWEYMSEVRGTSDE